MSALPSRVSQPSILIVDDDDIVREIMRAELEGAGAGRVTDAEFLTAAQASRAVFEFREERQASAKVEAERKRLADSQRMDDTMETPADTPTPAAAHFRSAPAARDRALRRCRASSFAGHQRRYCGRGESR